MSVQVEILSGSRGRCIIEVGGRLDTRTYPHLESKIAQVDWSKTPLLILDLKGLEHITSAGVRSILKARREGAQHGGQVYLMQLQEQVRKVFAIIKAIPSGEIFAGFADLEAHLARIASTPRA